MKEIFIRLLVLSRSGRFQRFSFALMARVSAEAAYILRLRSCRVHSTHTRPSAASDLSLATKISFRCLFDFQLAGVCTYICGVCVFWKQKPMFRNSSVERSPIWSFLGLNFPLLLLIWSQKWCVQCVRWSKWNFWNECAYVNRLGSARQHAEEIESLFPRSIDKLNIR